MKVVIATIVILALFFVGTFYIGQYVQNASEEILNSAQKIDRAIQQERWEEAAAYIEDLNVKWSDIKKRWLLFMEHYEIDIVDTTIAKLERYVELEELALSTGEVVNLEQAIDHIVKKGSLELSNIL
ncbi:DUF4363 family protein [Serpentinicella sp. ANB-PHB4]|uniref:DUF4363 family protein n=1 Tax=Serpentinicella sp. ANB-PHB4 TaxID=3074076 RepID=UPI0028672044|nr:DUF4363 family protein [Serpentinicella sp. ANB-PHB4]MDR5659475.1 DUF4363 family protein [Serpentinicella sp. ANB-PHB4]